MIYYEKVDISDHLLYAEEIARYYNVFSNTGKLHSGLIKVIILDYEKKNLIQRRNLYYSTRNGLREVFDPHIAGQAMEEFLRKNRDNTVYNSLSGILYKFKLKV